MTTEDAMTMDATVEDLRTLIGDVLFQRGYGSWSFDPYTRDHEPGWHYVQVDARSYDVRRLTVNERGRTEAEALRGVLDALGVP